MLSQSVLHKVSSTITYIEANQVSNRFFEVPDSGILAASNDARKKEQDTLVESSRSLTQLTSHHVRQAFSIRPVQAGQWGGLFGVPLTRFLRGQLRIFDHLVWLSVIVPRCTCISQVKTVLVSQRNLSAKVSSWEHHCLPSTVCCRLSPVSACARIPTAADTADNPANPL
jgi:hypothetical protein